ncbi:MAG TPA: GNAT family N-acetyltransferase [Actinomycetaceae bacterium]|nr:GNAT family N-acetyltransferase [Actinomycetaceae bacterium]
MTLRSSFLSPHDRRWAEVLARIPHDIYQMPRVVEMEGRYGKDGEPVAYVVEDEGAVMLMPMYRRAIPGARDGLHDMVGPRAFSGPVYGGPGSQSEAFMDRAAEAFRRDLREAGCVSAYIRLHPLLSPPAEVLARHGAVVHHVDSVSVDLTLSEEQLWRQTRSNHRRDIRKAEKNGYTVHFDRQWERLDEFAEAYDQSMSRLDAEDHWRTDRNYFHDLLEALGENGHLVVAEHDGKLAAGAIIGETGDLVDYHSAGTMTSHVSASPTKLIIHFVTLWARDRGRKTLHLGSTVRLDDSLMHFKLGFSPDRHPFNSWRVIADQDAYDELVAASTNASDAVGDETGRDGTVGDETGRDGTGGDGGFFPEYRRPARDLRAH